MRIFKLSKNKILLIVLIVVGVIGYYMFSSSNGKEALVTTQVGAPGTIGQELVVEVNRLRALQNIDEKIFKDPAFISLQDYTQTVSSQPLGRSNPLAPIGSDI